MRTTRRLLLLSALSCLSSSLIACGGSASTAADRASPSGDVMRSAKQRDTAPAAPTDDVATLTSDNNAFAFDAYAHLRAHGANAIFAPYSLSIALAMTYAGARGETASQIAHALHFTLPQERLHPAFDALDLAVTANAAGTLAVAASLWGDRSFDVERSFLDVMSADYGAGLRLVDFRGAPEAARATINGWVSDETHGSLPELLPAGTITSSTRLSIVNAVHFRADWQHAFDPKLTLKQRFRAETDAPDDELVDMMLVHATFPYASTPEYSAIELPYRGGQLALTIVMPAPLGLDSFEKSLDAPAFAKIVQSLAPIETDLTLPKLALGGNVISLKEMLTSMGMIDAFGPADFSGITPEEVSVSDVLHASKISWDEAGAEASGATAVNFQDDSGGPLGVRIDRPFFFALRDTASGAILFLGRVATIR
jgi:serpin B